MGRARDVVRAESIITGQTKTDTNTRTRPYDVEAEAPLRRQVHDAKLENEELRRLLETEQRRRREGTDKYQAISKQLHAAREETSQEVRLRKEIEVGAGAS